MRIRYDNMLKEIKVIAQLDPETSIQHMLHQTRQCLVKMARDSVVLVSCRKPDHSDERKENGAYVIAARSIDFPSLPVNPNISRAQIILGGWIIEPYVPHKMAYSHSPSTSKTSVSPTIFRPMVEPSSSFSTSAKHPPADPPVLSSSESAPMETSEIESVPSTEMSSSAASSISSFPSSASFPSLPSSASFPSASPPSPPSPPSPTSRDKNRGLQLQIKKTPEVCSLVTYIVQVDLPGGAPPSLINRLGRKQPLCIHYLRAALG